MKYEIKCAWCGATLRTDAEVEHSHGICEECSKRLIDEYKKSRQAAAPA